MLRTAINWLMGRLLRLMPETLRGRLLPGRARFRTADIPSPPAAPATGIRLYIAPANFAGQAWQWARAAERFIPDVGATTMATGGEREAHYSTDYRVPFGVYAASTRWQKSQYRHVVGRYTHVMVESEKQPFGAVLDESTSRQVLRLKRDGIAVSMLCHGSDIRLPSRHLRNEPYSPFHDALAAAAPAIERRARENRALLDRLDVPVFVSTPDLLLDVPQAEWLPVVVEAEAWVVNSSPFERAVPVVAHAPSSGPIKGSDQIDPILQRLHDLGVVVYRRIEGISHSKMRSFYGDADIVLDQFRIGDYGVAAVEAMAAGRLVVSHVSDHSRRAAAAAAGLELPIVEATIENLETILYGIIADPDGFARLAARGVQFVERLHNGEVSARVLKPFLTGDGSFQSMPGATD